jgi:hypothetical protein
LPTHYPIVLQKSFARSNLGDALEKLWATNS